MGKFWNKLLDFFFPEGVTCNGCECELTDEDDRETGYCKECLAKMEGLVEPKKAYEGLTVYSLFRYDDLVRKIVIGYKDDDKTFLAPAMARFLARFYRGLSLDVDIVCFIPCGKKNKIRRGYDPMKEVAKFFCKETDLLFSEGLFRVRDSVDQALVESEDRRKNIQDCFCAENVEGKKVLLLDDIVTSGSTLLSAATELYKAGAKNVVCITFSRA